MDKVLDIANTEYERERENEVIWYKEMLGEKAIRQINENIQRSLLNPKCVSREDDGNYKVFVQMNELDMTCAYRHYRERYYFQNKYANNGGVPNKLLFEQIAPVSDLTFLRLETSNFSEMYHMKYQDFCSLQGLTCLLMGCCLPVLCMTCRSCTLKPYHIDTTFTIWFKKHETAIGLPAVAP
jgi:hypothetical protein